MADFIFLGCKITEDCDYSHEIKRGLPRGRKAMRNLDSVLKSSDSADKGPYSQSCGFSSSYVWMWELNHQEAWLLKNLCFQIVVLEKTLESPLDCKETKPVKPKENQPWIFIGRTCWSWSSKTLAIWWKGLTHWKRPWCWERLKTGGEGGNRGWDDWMSSLTQWTWIWANSRR